MKSTSRRKKSNLRDVARYAEVSVATVSRVLNTPEVVKSATRQKVEQAIKELGFFRSAAARAINTGRTKIVGALIPSLDNDIFALTLDALEGRLADFGFSLVVSTTEGDPDIEARKARELLNIGVEGLIVPGVSHNEDLFAIIRHAQVPTVAISYHEATYELPTVGYDNRHAACLALDHLLELGHRHIVVVHGPTERNDRTRARLAGVQTSRADTHISFVSSDLSISGGCAAAAKALDTIPKIDAFLCVSDVLAFGVIFEVQRQGHKVPEDFSVVGIHDLPSAGALNPALSSVHLPSRKMGRKAAESLSQWIEEGIRPEPVCFETELIARFSTRRK